MYPGVIKYFSEKGIEHPTLQEIRNAIIEIRSTKLPDPKKIKNNRCDDDVEYFIPKDILTS
jgi:hypothetical protein